MPFHLVMHLKPTTTATVQCDSLRRCERRHTYGISQLVLAGHVSESKVRVEDGRWCVAFLNGRIVFTTAVFKRSPSDA